MTFEIKSVSGKSILFVMAVEAEYGPILRTRIEKENKLPYDYIAPKIPYRETITKVAQADYRHKKQSGGAGQFGEVHMIIEPYYDNMPEPKNYKVPGKGDMS